MPDLTIYGDIRSSRTWWVAWTCRELELEFENVPIGAIDPGKQRDELLALNPNGLVPTIRDGDFLLWEALAINLYLAKKSGGSLYPASLEGEALAWQWSFWAATTVETPLLTLMVAGQGHAPGSELEQYFLKRVPAWTPDEIARCGRVLDRPLRVLDGELSERAYLLGDAFTVADLNVCVILSRNSGARLDLSSMPHLTDWLARCWSRPACPRRDALLRALEGVR